MGRRCFVHFDAHFHNILTDGQRLYFSDFGLALSSRFELSAGEAEFLKTRSHYDFYSAFTNLLHCIVVHLLGEEEGHLSPMEYLRGELGEFPPAIALVVKQYAPIALAMDSFYQNLQKKSKGTPYPVAELEALLALSEEGN